MSEEFCPKCGEDIHSPFGRPELHPPHNVERCPGPVPIPAEAALKELYAAVDYAIKAMENMRQGTFRGATALLRKAKLSSQFPLIRAVEYGGRFEKIREWTHEAAGKAYDTDFQRAGLVYRLTMKPMTLEEARAQAERLREQVRKQHEQ